MDFHILGPLEVLDDGRAIALGGKRQRALLAVLLLHVNETLTTDRLIDELWGERAPPTAVRTLHVQVSRLRKALADGAASSDAGRGGPISTHEHGYAILVERRRLDAHRFEDLVAEGGRELAAGRPAPAASAFERALALWRGAPLGDLAYERFAQREVARLEELRVGALEQLVDAQLELGRHADAAGQLRDLIAEHPYRERFRGQLMLALYRCDRQADALQVFQDTRRVLVEELGIEPGERLRELERAILAQDAALEAPATEAPPQAPAREAPPRRDAVRANARKVVTVVVADPAGSTALADGLDPESLHGALGYWSARCAGVLERHGGTVEESAGDAVVGVFGLGDRHEDDPLRAVRAALELRDASAAPDPDRGPAVAVGVGIDSGEVFVAPDAGSGARVRGDAMHVAAALGQAAADGEILVAERAQRFVAHAVRAERLEPLMLRGRREAVAAWRLLGLAVDEPLARSASATPFVARDRELAALHAALATAAGEHRCHRVTVVGPPGIGKSRLAHEFIAGVGEARVAVGRCLSYGDGIAYRPLAEMLRRHVGDDPEQWLRARLAGDERVETIVRRVLGAIGRAEEASQPGETSWAMRKLFEAVARDGPLVVVVEDAHWADPTLLDLLEYVVAFSSGAPILLVCLARPELLEERPAWAAPQRGSSLVVLEPLDPADARALVEAAGADVAPTEVMRIVAAAEGNPLFLEQLLAASTEDGAATTLPPNIEAVLAARIDRLEPPERDVLVHASLEGRQFHAGAVGALMPAVGAMAIAMALVGLVQKQFIHPDRPEFPGEDGFRFAHALIRDAAYAGMPKQLRGELHERIADWLKERPRAPDELVGYHLEHAVRYRLEVGQLDPHDRALAGEAADRLAAAARAALVRGDAAAAGRLLERAVALVPAEDQARPALLTTLGADARRGGPAGRRRPGARRGDRARRRGRRPSPRRSGADRAGARASPRGRERRDRAGAPAGRRGAAGARAPRRRVRPVPGLAAAGVDRVDREPGRGRRRRVATGDGACPPRRRRSRGLRDPGLAHVGGRLRADAGGRGDPTLRADPRPGSQQSGRRRGDTAPARAAARDARGLRARAQARRRGRRDPRRARPHGRGRLASRSARRAAGRPARRRGGAPAGGLRRARADGGAGGARDDRRDARAGGLPAGPPRRGGRSLP